MNQEDKMKRTPKLKKEKKVIYMSGEEAVVEKEKILKKLNVKKAQLDTLQDRYLEIGKQNATRQRKNLSTMNRLARKETRVQSAIQRNKVALLQLENGTYQKLNVFQKILKIFRNLSYNQQKAICGVIFVLPWFIGFCLFFAKPLITTIWWSFNDVTPIAGGGLDTTFIGFNNYVNLFTVQMFGARTFLEIMTLSIQPVLLDVVVILIFSLLIAVILNTKFKGHQIFKAIFFIPVVYNSTVISTTLNGAFGGHMSESLNEMVSLSTTFSNYLLQIGLGEELIVFLTDAVNSIFSIVNHSGIQILIFIAALQSIPKHLYEAAKVEGATTYECFWKITVPMVFPMFIPIIVYTVVDSFASSEIMEYMTRNSAGARLPYGVQSTVAMVYFLVNVVIILLIFAILKAVGKNND